MRSETLNVPETQRKLKAAEDGILEILNDLAIEIGMHIDVEIGRTFGTPATNDSDVYFPEIKLSARLTA